MSGKNLIYGAIVMLAALSFVNPASAGQGGGGGGGGGGRGPGGGRGGPPPGGGDQQNGDNNKPPKPPRGPELIGFILDHRTDLSLTDEQVAALQALPKPPKDGDAKPPKDGPPPPRDGPPPPHDGQRPPKDGPPPPVMEAIKQILTPAQMDILRDLLNANKPPKPAK